MTSVYVAVIYDNGSRYNDDFSQIVGVYKNYKQAAKAMVLKLIKNNLLTDDEYWQDTVDFEHDEDQLYKRQIKFMKYLLKKHSYNINDICEYDGDTYYCQKWFCEIEEKTIESESESDTE